MKKVVVNISNCTYEKLYYESIALKKSVQKIIEERLLERPFPVEVEEQFKKLMESQIEKILQEN